ncbi:cytochrome P450 [Aeromicrobium choanae]|uniref:Cytochrome P450 n=1 Tax=Aeromicrobium choanae TaxID=1736691 RepID=A0A1T4Z4W4_9ACTN|nr:cytochrome P450 [Aeromicrobium choanae]SKB08913.1 hypothetical protein SAMN06295964_2392 [Aeromicrobium choanae]
MTTGAMPTSPLPVFDEDPFSPEILEDPVPFHRRLLAAGPIAYLSHYDVHVVSRYDEVRTVLANWQELVSGNGVGLNEPWRTTGLLETDPPRHDAPREVLADVMSARAMRPMADECSRQAAALIDGLVAERAEDGHVAIDGYQDVGKVFPVNFFADAAGVCGRENLTAYADHVFNSGGPRNDLVKKGEARAPQLAEWANGACQRDALEPQGFGADIWAAADRGDILHEQAPLLTRSLLSAGVDTTVYGLSAVLYAFATHPDQWELLKSDPHLARVAFDEALRWESPVQMLFRKSAATVTLGGETLPEGRRVLICYGAANRDPRRWEDPDRFDLRRDPSGHLAFGMGIHQCVGQHVARLQAESLLNVLLERVDRIELAAPPTRQHNNTLRGWGSIPLRLHLS